MILFLFTNLVAAQTQQCVVHVDINSAMSSVPCGSASAGLACSNFAAGLAAAAALNSTQLDGCTNVTLSVAPGVLSSLEYFVENMVQAIILDLQTRT
jgi:hypothetical protein